MFSDRVVAGNLYGDPNGFPNGVIIERVAMKLEELIDRMS